MHKRIHKLTLKAAFFICPSILRKVNSLGLKQSYENDLNFPVQVRCLSALSFVPIGDIPAVFSQLADTFPDDNASHALLQHICWGHRSWRKKICQCCNTYVGGTEVGAKDCQSQRKGRRWQKRVWVLCLRVVVLSLSNPVDPYFLAWWLLQQLLRRKVFFKIQKN